MRVLSFLFAIAMLGACSSQADTAPDAAPVIAAERAFAAEAGRTGWVEAFLAHSTDDAIVLARAPENAHESLSGIDPANRGDTSLTWGPDFAGISRGGDFGFTTGPYNGGGAAFGQYFTVWRRGADGSWKWIYDGGTNQRTPTVVNPTGEVTQLALGARGAGSAEAATEAVRRREAEFAEAAARDAGAAFAAAMAPQGRMNRDDQPSANTPEAAAQLAGAGAIRYSPPSVAEAGAAGDMVFTLGEARWEGGAGYYCRIWVLTSAGWKIGYDQVLLRVLPPEYEPVPPPPEHLVIEH
ncbi:MAG TPA: hypothetical protein VEA80_16780 [Vitreimonas sp.]|uniref:hypothetical protein n=1 Tax=Vitreimonas sp. TaxID=3069702 RepID=UPI002D2EDA32|nr:hypothetical protein [Vitreimonas sp.]HYD89135.1 hypothetical protein [Vitreimonas sp.]